MVSKYDTWALEGLEIAKHMNVDGSLSLAIILAYILGKRNGKSGEQRV